MIKAQKKRINQKALVVSEFQSGFDGIQLKESAKVKTTQAKRKSKKKPGKLSKGRSINKSK